MRLNTIVIGAGFRVENAVIYGAIKVALLDWRVPGWLSGSASEETLTSLHPRTMAPVYIKLSANCIRVGEVIQEHSTNIFDIPSYVRSKRKCIAPPRQSIGHRQLNRARRGDVIFVFTTSFILETIRQVRAAVRRARCLTCRRYFLEQKLKRQGAI